MVVLRGGLFLMSEVSRWQVQVAAQAMFNISFNHADCLREGNL